ncbi:hypothetical protein Tco_0459799 [Tanacetum coccineum]
MPYLVLNKETIRIEESLNVTFEESLPEPKSSSSVEDDRIDEPIVQDLNGSPSLLVNVSDEGYPKSLKEARVQDYALWDVIENGNSFKPVAQTTTNANGTSTSVIPGYVTTEEKAQKKNDVKARSMLLMTLPNEHLMTFKQYKDAKTLFAAIQTRFVVNDATKKTHKTLLKQMYENFSAPSTESLDSIFNRL